MAVLGRYIPLHLTACHAVAAPVPGQRRRHPAGSGSGDQLPLLTGSAEPSLSYSVRDGPSRTQH